MNTATIFLWALALWPLSGMVPALVLFFLAPEDMIESIEEAAEDMGPDKRAVFEAMGMKNAAMLGSAVMGPTIFFVIVPIAAFCLKTALKDFWSRLTKR